MPSGPHQPSQSLQEQVSGLLVKLLCGDASRTSRPASHSVASCLAAKISRNLLPRREAAADSVYLNSLRLDVALWGFGRQPRNWRPIFGGPACENAIGGALRLVHRA